MAYRGGGCDRVGCREVDVSVGFIRSLVGKVIVVDIAGVLGLQEKFAVESVDGKVVEFTGWPLHLELPEDILEWGIGRHTASREVVLGDDIY